MMKGSKRMVILGAGGQLGREFVNMIKGRNNTLINYDKDSLDITDFELVRKEMRVVKPDVVINCAAYNNVDEAEVKWADAFMVNGYAVKNLANICNEIDSVLVHFSSDYVFGGRIPKTRIKSYLVSDFPCPVNRYGESKLCGEQFLRESGCKYFLIRTSWLFGMNFEVSFPLKLCKWVEGKMDIKVVDDQISCPTYVRDLVEATLKLVDKGEGGIYHITNRGSCSRYEFAKYFLDKLGWYGKIFPAGNGDFNTLADRPKISTLNNFPLKRIFGIEMPGWKNAVDRFISDNNIKI